MRVVVVENILNNHSSHVVYNTEPQAHDTESLDLEKTFWEENTQKYIVYPFTVIDTQTWAGYFRDFPQELNFNFLIHDTTHFQEYIGEEIIW